jgi:hypothetical protein
MEARGDRLEAIAQRSAVKVEIIRVNAFVPIRRTEGNAGKSKNLNQSR